MPSMDLDVFMKQCKQSEPYVPKVNKRVVSITEYARITGMSPSTIRFRLQQGRLAGFKQGKNWSIEIEDDDNREIIAENEKLKAENQVLKMQLSCIQNIISARPDSEYIPYEERGGMSEKI